MEAPRELQFAAEENVTATRRGYEDENVVGVDFGPGVDATPAVGDETAIVASGDRPIEFAVPPEATAITNNDSILVIRESRRE